MKMNGMLSRFKSSIRTRGFTGTLFHYSTILLNMAKDTTPAGRSKRIRQRELDLEFAQKRDAVDKDFDAIYQLDTGGKIELNDLAIEDASKNHGNFYQAVFPDRFKNWVDSLQINPREYVFVDIGAGKGRALFLAQDYGFKRVVGVEFAKELTDTCANNIQRRAADGINRPSVEILHMDAIAYDLPNEPLVLFMYNPFGAEIMSKMADRIADSLHRTPRRLYVVYGNPVCDEVISRIPGLRRLVSSDFFNSYEWRP